MLENEIKKLTDAVVQLTTVLQSQPGPVATLDQSIPVTSKSQVPDITGQQSTGAAAVADIFGTETSQTPPAPTIDDVRTTLVAYLEKNGDQKALALLKKYGANKVTELKETDYAKIIADAAA